MATGKQRFKKIADDVQEAAGKASVKVEDAIDRAKDAASDAARDVRRAGRNIDDRLDSWADENATAVSDRLGTDPETASGWLKVAVWVGVLAGLIAVGWVGARLL